MADNFLERQYATYEEKKAAAKSGIKKKKPSVKFYTRPGKKAFCSGKPEANGL